MTTMLDEPTIDQPVSYDRDAAADVAAVRLALTLPRHRVTIAYQVAERTVARRLGASVIADAARADALACALDAISRLPFDATDDAARRVARTAADRAAIDALRAATANHLPVMLSLDAPTGDGDTLADLLDSDAAARLSHYDEAAGAYRGVARVPHPDDVLRPILPAPEALAEWAHATLTDHANRVLDHTVAANVAAQAQHRAEAAALAEVVDALRGAPTPDLTWLAVDTRQPQLAGHTRRLAKTSRDLLARHRARSRVGHEEEAHRPWRPRTETVTQTLHGASTGRLRAQTSRDQLAAYTAYEAARAAATQLCIANTDDYWTALADQARRAVTRRARTQERRTRDARARWAAAAVADLATCRLSETPSHPLAHRTLHSAHCAAQHRATLAARTAVHDAADQARRDRAADGPPPHNKAAARVPGPGSRAAATLDPTPLDRPVIRLAGWTDTYGQTRKRRTVDTGNPDIRYHEGRAQHPTTDDPANNSRLAQAPGDPAGPDRPWNPPRSEP